MSLYMAALTPAPLTGWRSYPAARAQQARARRGRIIFARAARVNYRAEKRAPLQSGAERAGTSPSETLVAHDEGSRHGRFASLRRQTDSLSQTTGTVPLALRSRFDGRKQLNNISHEAYKASRLLTTLRDSSDAEWSGRGPDSDPDSVTLNDSTCAQVPPPPCPPIHTVASTLLPYCRPRRVCSATFGGGVVKARQVDDPAGPR